MYNIESYILEQAEHNEHFSYKKQVRDLEAERRKLEKKHRCWQTNALGEKKKVKNISFNYKIKQYA